MLGFEITLAPQTVQIIIGILLPLLVGAVTKLNASKAVKSFVLLVLSLIGGTISQAIGADGSAFFSQDMLIGVAATWVVAIATYYGFWKPSGTAPAISEKTAAFGIGKEA